MGGESIYDAVPGKAPRQLGLYEVNGKHLAGKLQQGDDLRRQPVLVDNATVGMLAGAPCATCSKKPSKASSCSRSATARSGRDEPAALAHNFNTVTATMERHEALRRHFMADISHELRMPLSVLQAQREAMQDAIEPLDAAALALARGEVHILARLAEDMRQTTLPEVAADTFAASQTFHDHALKCSTIAILLGLAFIAAAPVLLLLLLLLLLLRAIMQPLDQALHHFDEIAAGDFSQPIDTQRTDEMGTLLSGLSKMQLGPSMTVQSVRTGNVAIAHASADISSGGSDLSHRTKQQAASLEETASSLEKLTAPVRQNAREASQLVLSASSVAGKGGAPVTQVVVTMREQAGRLEQLVSTFCLAGAPAIAANSRALVLRARP